MEGDFIVINFFALVLVKETILSFFYFIFMSRVLNFSKDVHEALVQSWCKSSHAQSIGPDL